MYANLTILPWEPADQIFLTNNTERDPNLQLT